jgi:hypothetical protein
MSARGGTGGIALLVAVLVLAAGAQAQSRQVTLDVRPTRLAPTQNALLSGRVSSGRTGETVTIQLRYCAQSTFRNLVAVRTAPGGVFQLQHSPGMNGTLRARWKGAVSPAVAVRKAPFLQLDETGPGAFEVGVGSLGLMWRKRVEIQRRSAGGWSTVRSVTLTDTEAGPGSGGVWTSAHFRLAAPPGTLLRAVLTAREARPCYMGTTSAPLRTT